VYRGLDGPEMYRSPSAKALPLIVLLTFVWGTMWALFPLAVREVSVWTFRSISLVGAGVLLLTIARLRGMSLVVPRSSWPAVTAAAFIYLVVWNLASTYAAILIPSGQAAILGFTMPLWTVLVVWLAFGERPRGRMMLAVALAALGVALLAVPAHESYATAPAGFLLGLLAGLGWAVGTVILKRANVPVPALVLTGWQLLVAAMPLALGALWLGAEHVHSVSWQTILVIAYITVVPMAIGNAAWFSIVALLPPGIAGLSSVMVPIVAMFTGALVRGEPLGSWQLGAMACSATAMFLALRK
jgi:drug/metabolite transporter (DMT)-like permease